MMTTTPELASVCSLQICHPPSLTPNFLLVLWLFCLRRRSFLAAESWYWKAISANELSPPDRGRQACECSTAIFPSCLQFWHGKRDHVTSFWRRRTGAALGMHTKAYASLSQPQSPRRTRYNISAPGVQFCGGLSSFVAHELHSRVVSCIGLMPIRKMFVAGCCSLLGVCNLEGCVILRRTCIRYMEE